MSNIWKIVKNSLDCSQLNQFFSPVINNKSVIMYVSAIDTNGTFSQNDILWANESAKTAFGQDIVGKKCYNIFQDKAQVCEFCTNGLIDEQENEPFDWVFFNEKIKRLFFITDVMIKIDGKRVRVEFAYDITEVSEQITSVYKKHFSDE